MRFDAPFSEQFYVFRQGRAFYFLTLSGKVFSYLPPRVDRAQVDRLVDDLNSEVFEVREAAQRRLVEMGSGVADILESRLKMRRGSLEQVRRLRDVVATLREREPRTLPVTLSPAKFNGDAKVQFVVVDVEAKRTLLFTEKMNSANSSWLELTENGLRAVSANPETTRMLMSMQKFDRVE